jgi:cytoskeleton protein RodZ
MSEDDLRPDPASGADGGAAAPASFGTRLAAAREAAGMSVGDMAARLRLHVNQVRAIESEDLARLPEAAYVRGFVRSYARAVNLDPTPLIEDFNRKAVPPADSVVDGMARMRDYSPVRAAAQEQASRWLVLGLAVIALVVLGLIGWYATREPAPVAAPASSAPATAAPMAAAPASTSVPAAQATPAVAVGATPDLSPEPPADNPVPVEPAPAPSQPVPEGSLALSLKFSGVSWVEVTDASGKVLVSQLARAGDVLQPVGAAPLSVVIGDASNATVTVRGQAFDLEAVARSNVARFSVK